MPRLRPIRRNPKTGLLPKGLKRRPSNKTWRKGHRLKTGKWVPGIWVFRAGKAARVKPIARPKPKKAPKVPRPPAPKRVKPRAKPKAKPKVKAKAKPKLPVSKAYRRVVERQRRRPPTIEERDRGFERHRKRVEARVAARKPRIKVARKPWSSERRRRARMVASRTKSSVVEADALIRRAKSKGVAYDTVDWERLQGKDLTFAGRVRRLNKMVGRTASKREEAMDIAARREQFREQRKRKRPPSGREEAARLRIDEELSRRAEQLERVLFGL